MIQKSIIVKEVEWTLTKDDQDMFILKKDPNVNLPHLEEEGDEDPIYQTPDLYQFRWIDKHSRWEIWHDKLDIWFGSDEWKQINQTNRQVEKDFPPVDRYVWENVEGILEIISILEKILYQSWKSL